MTTHRPLPRFPLAALVPWQRDMVETVAESTQTDPAMAAMISLGVLSASVARKAVVAMPSGRRFPLNLWILVAAGSGENKSTVFQHLVDPLETVQGALDAMLAASAKRPAGAEVGATDHPDREARAGTPLETAVRAIAASQAAVHDEVPPSFLTTETTPTALIDMMASQVGGIAQISAEGGFEAWIATGGERARRDQGLLNLAWDGASIRQTRLQRRVAVNHATLTTVVTLQPARLAALAKNANLRAVGYTLRFLVAFPESRRGLNRAPFPPLSAGAVASYRAAVWRVLGLPTREVTIAGATPHELRVTRDAASLYDAFYNELQPRVREGCDLASVHDWIDKLRLNAVRIAGVLHIARHAPRLGPDAFAWPVEAESMEAAIAIARALIPHGVLAFGDDAAAAGPHHLVLAALEELPGGQFTVRDLQRSRHGRSMKSTEIRAALDAALARGLVTRVQDRTSSGGRPAGEVFALVRSDSRAS